MATTVLGFRALAVAVESLVDQLHDRRVGTDTSGVVELDTLDIASPNRGRGVRYEPTPARPFRKLMTAFGIPRSGTFVDFGCGKGRVVLLAAECGFTRVVGVDFSRELCDIARQNVSRYLDRGGTSTIEVIESDAIDYDVKSDDKVFFFFNPFDEVVMARVLDNIKSSLTEHPREIWLIYYNPVAREMIDRCGFLREIGDRIIGGCRFVVYASDDNSVISA